MKLIADIGGTNARFALIDNIEDGIQHAVTLRCEAYQSLAEAVMAYLSNVSQPMPSTAVIAIAAPVLNDWVDMTNHTWLLSIDDIRDELDLESIKLLNDYTALALALPHLAADEVHQIGRGFRVEDTAMAVLGPGTGLGMSGLINAGGYWMPLEGEGGHVPFWSYDERDMKILEIIKQQYKLVSAEMVVSGPGLALLYRAIAERNGFNLENLTPAEVGERAIAGRDAVAVEAVRFFSGALGTVASNLALTLGARGGVYIGGGVISKLGSSFDENAFRTHFEKNSEFQPYLSDVPTYLIDAKYPALLGAMIASRPEYAHLGVSSESW